MRRFTLWREVDVSGISGTGTVAEGCEFSDGSTVVHWVGELPSTSVWPSVRDVAAIHGHNGKTQVRWVD